MICAYKYIKTAVEISDNKHETINVLFFKDVSECCHILIIRTSIEQGKAKAKTFSSLKLFSEAL